MHPPLSWSDLAGRAVGLYGLGREGQASWRACQARGIDPVLVDDDPQAGLEWPNTSIMATAADGLDRLLECDVVVKSPGISRYSPIVSTLTAAGVRVVGGLGLWLQGADRSRVIAITGTKGKSTTTAIAGHLLRGLGHRALIGGNLGVPPWDPDVPGSDGAGVDYWVVEVSSYQALDLTAAPPVVGVTSLHPDHLPWHGGESEQYFRDKLSICTLPGAKLTIANGDSELLLDRRELLGPRVRWVHADDEPGARWLEPLQLLGSHNRRNGLMARALLESLGVPGSDDDVAITQAATGFAGLESRLQVIGEIEGVTFVDDSLSTNVLPTLAAVDAFPERPVALIVGGLDRGIDYRPLAEGLRQRAQALIVITVPDNGARIAAVVRATGPGAAVTVLESADLRSAVDAGFEWARPGGVVLLSPAAASFGRFRDYRERATAFAEAMRGCARPDAG